MAPQQQQNGDSSNDLQDADFAKAFQELSRGEQTATALENHLSALEAKIEELLAATNQQDQSSSTSTSTSTASITQDPSGQSGQ